MSVSCSHRWLLWYAVLLTACSGALPAAPRSRLSTRELVDKTKPGIVRIESRFANGKSGVGTGFVVATSGRIATNLHVIQGSKEVIVTLLDGRKFPVKRVVTSDPRRDLAIVAIEGAKGLSALPLGNSDELSAGDHVIAIGNPLGVLDYTVSDGLISSVRSVSDELKLLQISAPISEGSSGGPVFNHFGEVIGVATMIASQGQNLNFAVPSNYLQTMLSARGGETLAEFTERFEEMLRQAAKRDERPRIPRNVPRHDLAILDGCQPDAIADVFRSIGEAITLGAPLYNDGKREACYRIYEGTTFRLEQSVGCIGLRDALGQGLLRASAAPDFTLKAWAMRDMFDGVLDVISRRARSGAARQSP